MLFLHETHRVIGEQEDEFEASMRDGWMKLLGQGDDARLLWYFNHAMGTGVSYNVITITAVKDGAAWERMALDVQHGELCDWAHEADRHRYEVVGKLMLPSFWSPMQEVDLASVPTDGGEHELTLFMHDTGWAFAHAALDEYIKFQDDYYFKPLTGQGAETQVNIDLQAFFQNAQGAGRRKECVFMQKLRDPQLLLQLIMNDLPPDHKAAGTYMGEGLHYRDQWESKLLRTARWSPLY
jgi:hypothetical protein